MAEDASPSRSSAARSAGWLGAFLVVAFFAASQTFDGIAVQFRLPSNAFAPSELLFWISACAFLIPGSTLIGVAFATHLGEGWSRFTSALENASARERRMLIVVLGIFGLCLARGGNQGVMLGRPFTDVENGIRFGAHLLVHGNVRATVEPWFTLAPIDFLHARGLEFAALDHPGPIVVAALAELTRSGTWLYSILGGITVLCVTALTVRLHGPRLGMLGGALALTSPSLVLLSMTSDPHVISRAFLALGLAAFLFVREVTFARGVAAGLAFGIAASVKPFEIAALTLPLLLGIALDARDDSSQRRLLLGMLAGATPSVLAVAAYDWAAHGSIFFTGFVDNDLTYRHRHLLRAAVDPSRWWSLFGGNLATNLIALGVFVAGPLGLPLAYLGRSTDRTQRRLFYGVVLSFGLAVARVEPVIRAAGPLPLADATIPLLLLGCAGAKRVMDLAERKGANRRSMRGGIAGYLGLGLPIFVIVQSLALARHAEVQEMIYRRIDSVAPRPAVVLAPPYLEVVAALPQGASTGTWLLQWRTPHADASDPVIILADRGSARADVRRWFPDRSVHVLSLGERIGFELVPLATVEERSRGNAGGSTAPEPTDHEPLEPLGR